MNYALILSGGVGTRMKSEIPKQYINVGGHPIIYYCLDTFLRHEMISGVIVAVADEWKPFVETVLMDYSSNKRVSIAPSGITRQFSIYNALKKAKECGCEDDDIVIIHDAARPMLSKELITRCLNGCMDADAVLPVVDMKDTVYYSKDGIKIDSLLDRSQLWSGQAPEAFRFGKYLKAHEEMTNEKLLKICGSTELAFIAGLKCKMVEGDPMNFKITTPEDLSNFESIIKNKSSDESL